MTTSAPHEVQSQQNAQDLGNSIDYNASTGGPSTTTKPYTSKPRSRLRSTGCKTCRQRKIKCDEQKPTCKNCTKSHRTCLGYNVIKNYTLSDTDANTIDNRSHQQSQSLSFEPRHQALYADATDIRRDSAYSGTSDEQSISTYDNMLYDPIQPTSYDRVQHRSGRSQSMDSHAPLPILTSPQQRTEDQLESFFFHRFITSVWLHSQVDAWQFYLPLALRNSSALYYSVMGLSALYMSRLEMQPRAREYALGLYQGTLAQLQKAIYDPTKALRDETLMATIIVGLYELIDKPDLASWTSHSRGTAELMKMRGTAVVRSGMGKMLFLTFRGYEVIRAILQCEETFVGDPTWTNESSSAQTIRASSGLLTETVETKESTMQSTPDYAAVLFMLGGQVANFQASCVRNSRHLNQNSPSSTPTTTTTQQERQKRIDARTLDDARNLEQKLKLWRSSLPQAYNAPDLTPPLDMGGYTIGYQLCFYSAFLLLLHRLVAKYVWRNMSRAHPESEGLARYILLTTQYLTMTYTSVNLNVTWPLYMASITLKRADEQQTAMDLLRGISRDGGWRVADSALSAANLAAHKKRMREATAAATVAAAASSQGQEYFESMVPGGRQ